MHLTNVRTAVSREVAGEDARGAHVRELTPPGIEAGLALDLWEIAAGGCGPRHSHPEEHQCYVLAGAGEYHGPDGAPVSPLREGAAFYVPAGERHQVRNTGATPLRVLVATPLAAERAPAPAVAAPGAALRRAAGGVRRRQQGQSRPGLRLVRDHGPGPQAEPGAEGVPWHDDQ